MAALGSFIASTYRPLTPPVLRLPPSLRACVARPARIRLEVLDVAIASPKRELKTPCPWPRALLL